MKKIFTLLFIFCSFFSFSQINIGNNQTICLGDTAQVIANVQSSGQCVGMDTVICGSHSMNFTSNLTRGFHFQAQSSFIISGLMCAIDNSGSGFNQSVQVVAFGDSVGGVWNPMLPTTSATPFTTLFSSIDDSTADYIFCNISVDSGQYYGVLGARHIAGAGASASMHNSYTSSTGANVMIDGFPTQLDRLYYQSSLSGGVALSGSFLGTTGNVGRVHMLTGGGVSWYDVNSGVRIGNGDTLNYAPTQTTFVAGVYGCAGQTYTDTMRLNVLNTQISTTGLSLCNGSITLTAASGFALYVWNNNSASPILPVNSPGTYYVNCTNSNGSVCQSPAITIYADTIPTQLGVSDSIEICQGDTVTLNGPSGYSSYSWSSGETTADIMTTSVGGYYVATLDANGCVGMSDTTTITIRTLHPNIWANALTLCNGFGTSVYTDNIYQSYLWNTGGTFSSYYSSTAGNFWVTVADASGCTGTSDTFTLVNGNFTFDLLPADSNFICNAGSSVILDAANSLSVATYQWNTGATTSTITTSTPGTYYCITTTLGGCSGVSDTVIVAGIQPQINYSGLSLCAGAITLDAGSYDIFSWNSGDSTQVLNINSAGDYYTFVTDSNGCTGYSDTISIYDSTFVYNIVPSGSTNICSGYTVDLDAGNQFTNHQWNTTATTTTITASTIGQYYATMTGPNGCPGVTDTVDVTNLLVNLSTTGYSLCNTNSYPTLSTSGSYYIYNWMYNGTVIDTVSSITTNLPGDYFLTVIDENGCTATSDTITIYLNNFAFNLTASQDSICQPGGQSTISAGTSYFSYSWNTGAITQQITVNTIGSYTVDVMDMNGCQGISNPFEVHNIVNTSAVTGLNNVMQNTVETYLVNQNPTSTYNWSVVGGTLQSGQGTNSVDILWTATMQGSMFVIETDANACIGDTVYFSVSISQPSGLNENLTSSISIYPNPFSESTLIIITDLQGDYNITLFDVTGQIVLSEKDLTQNTYELERGKLSKGIYFLEVEINESKVVKRLVIN